MPEIEARYKFDGRCPDCGGHVAEEPEQKRDNRWQVRYVYIDCGSCSYSATAIERKRATNTAMWPGSFRKPYPLKWVERETISPQERMKNLAEWINTTCNQIQSNLQEVG